MRFVCVSQNGCADAFFPTADVLHTGANAYAAVHQKRQKDFSERPGNDSEIPLPGKIIR